MKAVIQRVNSSSVEVEGKVISKIDKGLLIFLGISKDFTDEKIDWMANKIANLRLWPSNEKGFDLSVREIRGEVLVVSQFTLFGECNKGTKPNFSKALGFDLAKEVYEKFISKLKNLGVKVSQGEFGAMMKVRLENDGPVTIILEK